MLMGTGFAAFFFLSGPLTGSYELAFLGPMLLGANAVWGVIDMFFIPTMAERYNHKLAERLGMGEETEAQGG